MILLPEEVGAERRSRIMRTMSLRREEEVVEERRPEIMMILHRSVVVEAAVAVGPDMTTEAAPLRVLSHARWRLHDTLART
jgi:hypothetical protein